MMCQPYVENDVSMPEKEKKRSQPRERQGVFGTTMDHLMVHLL
jgi:hypothetical protein